MQCASAYTAHTYTKWYVTQEKKKMKKKCTSFLKPFSGKLINAYIRQMHVCMPWRPLYFTSISLLYSLLFFFFTWAQLS